MLSWSKRTPLRGETSIKVRGRNGAKPQPMKEDICSIPVNEIFEKMDGCPICRMRRDLEERAMEFVLGAAMMEPDVRHETNRLGFCPEHLRLLSGRSNRLSFALVLQSHLGTIDDALLKLKEPGLLRGAAAVGAAAAKRAAELSRSCYVCERTERSLEKQLSTVFTLFKREQDFRDCLKAQPCLCLGDYALLLEKGAAVLDKKSFSNFYEAVNGVMRRGLEKLESDMEGFVKMYDYHSNGLDFGDLRDAVKNSVAFLGGRTNG